MPTETASPHPRRERIVIIALIVLGLILTAVFGLRVAHSFGRLPHPHPQPGTTDVEAIRAWMTIPYLARVYGVPEAYLFAQIGVPPAGNRHKNLRQLSRTYANNQPQQLIDAVKAAIRQYWATHPAQGPPSP